MSTILVQDGDEVEQDPSDRKVYAMDWDTDNLPAGVTIASQVWKVSAVGSVGATIEQSITSITRSSSTATVTTAAAHGYATGDSVTIAGAITGDTVPIPSAYNGTFQITVTGANTFTYTVSGTPATPAAGTITASVGMDEVSLLSSAPYSSRYTQFRFTNNTRGALYEFSNRIVTSESPAQAKERSFRVRMTHK